MVLEKTPENPLDSKTKPVRLKGDQLWIFTERTDAEAEAPVFWLSDAHRWLIGSLWCWEGSGQKKRASEDKMAGQHHRCNEHEFGQTRGDAEGQGGLACYSLWGHKESDITGWLNNNNIYIHVYLYMYQAAPHGLWDLIFPTRGWTWAPAVKAPSPNHPTPQPGNPLQCALNSNLKTFWKAKYRIYQQRNRNAIVVKI